MIGREPLEHRQIGPIRIARHGEQLGAIEAKAAEQVVVTRIVDQHGVAGLDEMANDQVERLARALSQDDLRRAGGDSQFREHEHDMLAKGQVAARIAVFDQVRSVLAGERCQPLTDAHFVHPVVGQPWAAREDGSFARFEQSTNEPDQLFVALLIIRR